MGNDGGPPRKAPAHKVRLSPYYIDQHEVTVRQFRLFLKETHYRGQPPHSWSEDFKQDPSDSLPMVMVNARDAQAYAEWAQKQLPTEAQWEMAARCDRRPALPLGPRPDQLLPAPRDRGRLEPVKSFPEDVSPYGVYDMAGNAVEWTKDWYDSKYYRQLFSQPVDNPTGPDRQARSTQLVVKGGAQERQRLVSARGSRSTSGCPTSASAASCRWPSSRSPDHSGPALPGHRPGLLPARRRTPPPGGEPRAVPAPFLSALNHEPIRTSGGIGSWGTRAGSSSMNQRDRPLDGSPDNVRAGVQPSFVAGLLGAVFEVPAQQPGPVAGDPRRLPASSSRSRTSSEKPP